MTRLLLILLLVLGPVGVARADASSASSALNKGIGAADGGESDAAIQQLSSAIKDGGLRPEQLATAHHRRGDMYRRLGKHDLAIQDYGSAIRLGADPALIHVKRGNTFLSKGLHSRAMEDYNAAIRLKPNAADNYSRRANIHLLRGHYDRAIKDLDNAIRLDPELASAHISRGTARLSKRLYAEAIEDFDKALTLNPGDKHATENRAVAVKSMQSRKRAERIARQRDEASKAPHPSLVRRTQKLLKQLGYAAGTPDGTIGPRTRDAVRAFQRRDGLAVDGRIEIPLVRRLEWAVARAASKAAAKRAKQKAAEAKPVEPPDPIEIIEAADHRIASVDKQGAVMAIMIDVGKSPSATRHVNEVTEALAIIVPTVRAVAPDVSRLFVFSIAETEGGQGDKNQGPVIAFVLPMAELRAVNLAHIGRNRVLDMTNVVVSRSGRDLLAEYCSEGNWLIKILQTGASSASLFTRAFRWVLPGYGSHFCLVTLQKAPVYQSAFLTTTDLLKQP